jgi:hypothetical protein
MITEKYPKVAELLHDYYVKLMLESLDVSQVPEDFKDSLIKESVSMDRIEVLILTNPRHLLDFFDNEKIYVRIAVDADGIFMFSIVGPVATLGSTKTYNTRKEAESDAIEQAMKQLELSLTKSISDKENS